MKTMNRSGHFHVLARFLAPAVIFHVIAFGSPFLPQASAAVDINQFIRARSVAHLKSLGAIDSELEHARAVCHVQLRDRLLPSACFHVVHLEKRLGLLRDQEMPDMSWIEKLCENRASLITRIEILETSMRDLPPRCRAIADERANDLRYQQEADAPEKLFLSRFKRKTRAEQGALSARRAVTVR
jgi:hypothetical protein